MTTIEKIRAELMKEYGNNANCMDWSYRAGLAKALDIIKEYAEQEPTDDKCHYCEHDFKPYQGNTGEFTEQEPCEECICSTKDGYCQYDDIAETIPIEPCEDAVSRQAVLECATLITSIPTEDWDIGDWVCLFRDRVKQLPSVQPKAKTGHWIMDRQLERRTCDNCNTEYRWSFYPHNYCPNCGAEMKGEQE